jgi:hypothetical protein
MKRVLFIPALFTFFCLAQPKDAIEFQVDKVSGTILNSATQTPVYDVKVKLLSGNNALKDSTFTDKSGYFLIELVGYVWKPKIRIESRNFQLINRKIQPDELDAENQIILNLTIDPISENERIPLLKKTNMEYRSETFFIKGNVFYYATFNDTGLSAERVVIRSREAFKNKDGLLKIRVNDSVYDPVLCYVPQMGHYENLTSIMDDYFEDPVFGPSGNPEFLPNEILEPSIIFGTIRDQNTGRPVFGAEVKLSGLGNQRITDNNGKFAFQVLNAGTYTLQVSPPLGSSSKQMNQPEIKINNKRGVWLRSDQYLVQ